MCILTISLFPAKTVREGSSYRGNVNISMEGVFDKFRGVIRESKFDNGVYVDARQSQATEKDGSTVWYDQVTLAKPLQETIDSAVNLCWQNGLSGCELVKGEDGTWEFTDKVIAPSVSSLVKGADKLMAAIKKAGVKPMQRPSKEQQTTEGADEDAM